MKQKITLPQTLPKLEAGTIWIAGAGPGAIGLLTLDVLNGLQQADIIIHDALVSEEILTLATDKAELIFAGKRGGKACVNQIDINDRLVSLAKEGRKILRLKGGDPFIYGRGCEEALILAKAGIKFRILSGITAGIGGLAAAGIPATHRDTNHAVSFITGHLAGEDKPELLDWQALAKGSPVLVLYMAMSHMDKIVPLLLAAGRKANEPVAIITNATRPDQYEVITTLEDAALAIKREGLEPPAIIVIGSVVSFRSQMGLAKE